MSQPESVASATRFRKKPAVVHAKQWHKLGDHTVVQPLSDPDPCECERCGKMYYLHGKITTLESGKGAHIVCPGDWIICGVQGEFYACKPDIFAATYEPESVASQSRPIDGEPPVIFSAGKWVYMGDDDTPRSEHDSRELDVAAWHKLCGTSSSTRAIELAHKLRAWHTGQGNLYGLLNEAADELLRTRSAIAEPRK